MCNLYQMTPKDDLAVYVRKNISNLDVPDYMATTVGPFQAGLILRSGHGGLIGQMGQWGMIRPGQDGRIDYIKPKPVPGKKTPAPRPRSTNNARIEGSEAKPTFSHAWKNSQRCLVPAAWYAEPNWETGKNIWWHLKRADGAPWFIAGLWAEWTDPETGEVVPNFTMITRNCDDHPMLARLHKPDPKLPPDQQDKRSLVHIDPIDWAQWLDGSEDEAKALLKLQPAEVFDQADARRTDDALASLNNQLF